MTLVTRRVLRGWWKLPYLWDRAVVGGHGGIDKNEWKEQFGQAQAQAQAQAQVTAATVDVKDGEYQASKKGNAYETPDLSSCHQLQLSVL